jgi:hypothetical protein
MPGPVAHPLAALAKSSLPSPEVLGIVVAILLPSIIFCWQTIRRESESLGMVVLQCPDQLRAGATLYIGDMRRDIAATGPLEYACRPGQVAVRVAIRGCAPLLRTVSVEAERRTTVSIDRSQLTWTWRATAEKSPEIETTAFEREKPVHDVLPLAKPPTEKTTSSQVPPAETAPDRDGEEPVLVQGVGDAGDARSTIVPGTAPLGSAGQAIRSPASHAPGVPPARLPIPAPSVATAPAARMTPGLTPMRASDGLPIASETSHHASSELLAVDDTKIDEAGGEYPPIAFSDSPDLPDTGTLDRHPGVVAMNERLNQPLVGAWGLIDRGDHELGRRVLLELQQNSGSDMRVAFGLGLLDALVFRDWSSAEQQFAECVRRQPRHVPSLNNLALARLRTQCDRQVLQFWETALDQGEAPFPIVHNLGRVRHLAKTDRLRADARLIAMVEDLYLRAALAANQSFQPQRGFLYMPLTAADGAGWSDARKYEDAWCVTCQGEGVIPCPNRSCVRGVAKTGQGGRVVCPVCRGNRLIPCNSCVSGRDKEVRSLPASAGRTRAAESPAGAAVPPGAALPRGAALPTGTTLPPGAASQSGQHFHPGQHFRPGQQARQ